MFNVQKRKGLRFQMACELCDTIDWQEGETHRIVECKTCHVPMLVLREHRNFTEFEKILIVTCEWLGKRQLYGKQIRWEQRKIKDHGHVHFE